MHELGKRKVLHAELKDNAAALQPPPPTERPTDRHRAKARPTDWRQHRETPENNQPTAFMTSVNRDSNLEQSRIARKWYNL